MKGLANFEAEAAVLGAVLLDGSLFQELIVQEAYFYHVVHKQIFRAMKEASDQEEWIDLVTVTTKLGPGIDQIGGIDYLVKLTDAVIRTESIKHHEQLIFQAYRLRKAQKQMWTFLENPTEQEFERVCIQLQETREIGGSLQEKTTYDYLLEIAGDMLAPHIAPSGSLTSYEQLDDLTGGFQKGELIIVAARPSVGKTAFALNMAAGHARQGGMASIFSLEMGAKALLKRMISAAAWIEGQKWRDMSFSAKDYEQAIHAIGQIADWDLHLYDSKHTLVEIISTIRRNYYDHKEAKHLVMIDYLQLIAPAGKRERRDLEIGEITRALKLLALELDLPIVLLSQLSRGVEMRANKRPVMSDLRESGNIEQDADVVMMLYREDYYERDIEEDRIEINIAKQRNGPTGTVELIFRKEYGRFVERKERKPDVSTRKD